MSERRVRMIDPTTIARSGIFFGIPVEGEAGY